MTRTKKVWARIIVVFTLLAVCSTLFRVFLPEVVSVSWHLLHGNSVQFGAWEVPVPWGWQERKDKDSVVVWKMEREIQDDNPVSDVTVSNLNLPVGSVIERDKWKKASIEDSLKSGYQFMSENEVQLDGETGFCFTFTGIDHSERLWIDCVFPIHRLSIQYIGTKANSQMLSSITQNVRASK